MNSIERISAVINAGKFDRRPVSLLLSLYGAKLISCPLPKYYSDPKAYADGQTAVLETFRPDILFTPFSLPLQGSAFGAKVRFYSDQAPNVISPAVNSVKDIAKIKVPDFDSHPVILYFRDAARFMIQRHKKEVIIAGVTINPFDFPAVIVGIENWMEALIGNSDYVQALLDITLPHFVKFVNSFFEMGAAFVVMPANFTNPRIVTRKIAGEISVPFLKNALSEVKGPVFIHSGGVKLSPFIGLFSELPNIAGFVTDSVDSLSEARENAGQEAVLVGNVDTLDLSRLSADEIKRKCLNILDERQGDAKFVLGSSGPDINMDVPEANIHAVRLAAEEFGGEN